MTQTEDLVRSTTRALAGTVQAVRPLPPLPQAPWPGEVSRGRGRRWGGWLAPLAAAAAMTVVVAVLVVVRDAPSGTGRGHVPAAGATAPEYYVRPYGASITSAISLVVDDTRTGKQVAAVSAPAGGSFIGVAGAGDDRTFVADAVHGSMGPVGARHYVDPRERPRTWYLVRIFPGSAQPVQLTPLPIAPTAEQTMMIAFALSPDGTSLAVVLYPDKGGKASGPAELRLYSIASGRLLRSWTEPAPGTVIPPGLDAVIDSNAGLTWLGDGHTLALESTRVSGYDSSGDAIFTSTIRALDVNRPGTNLLASTRVVWSSATSGPAAKCVQDVPAKPVLLSGDGKTVICGTTTRDPSNLNNPGCAPETLELVEYSVATGRLLRALAKYPSNCASEYAEFYPLSASAAGNEVIAYLDTTGYTVYGDGVPGVTRFGVFGAGTFRSLPSGLPDGDSSQEGGVFGGTFGPDYIAW